MLRRQISGGLVLGSVRHYVYKPPGTRDSPMPWYNRPSKTQTIKEESTPVVRKTVSTSIPTTTTTSSSSSSTLLNEEEAVKLNLKAVEEDEKYNRQEEAGVALLDYEEDNWMGDAGSPTFANRQRSQQFSAAFRQATAPPTAANITNNNNHNHKDKKSSSKRETAAAATGAPPINTLRDTNISDILHRSSSEITTASEKSSSSSQRIVSPSRSVLNPSSYSASPPPMYSLYAALQGGAEGGHPSSLTTASTSSSNHNNNNTQLNGGLKQTPTRRMSVLTGPSLDTQLTDIVSAEGSLSSEPLLHVVRRLIDKDAEGVEDITMADFVCMQPRRQLAALHHKKPWLEWLVGSAHYKQVARLAQESPENDLRALQEAGIVNLHQWVEQPNLVRVSARTRSALDAAVEESIVTYMKETAAVVNAACELEPLLHRWAADVVGKFVLDSLKINVEQAAVQAQRQRQAHTAASHHNTEEESDPTQDAIALQLMTMDNLSSSRKKRNSSSSSSSSAAPHYGDACTLTHYQQFIEKVGQSVRKDYIARHDLPPSFVGDAQMEMELTSRTYTVISAAFQQVFRQASQQLPEELKPLHENGYLALERLPGLYQQAVACLQLRDIPVRYFVLHSTANSTSSLDGNPLGTVTSAPTPKDTTGSDSSSHNSGPSDVDATPFPAGTFLTGTEQPDVTLKEWRGFPAEVSGALPAVQDPAQQEYFSVLRRLQRQTDKLSTMSVLEVLQDSDEALHGSFSASAALGLHQLFGPAKLVEDRLVSALHCPSLSGDTPIHFVEASYTSGKTALLHRLLQRAGKEEKVAMIRYSSTATPFIPDLDDHPAAFPARFWFRAALACAPYLIRVEELFSRAPTAPLWWGHQRNWSYESFHKMIHVAAGAPTSRWSGTAVPGLDTREKRLTTILADDMDKPLNSMEQKWGKYIMEERKRGIISANELLLRDVPVVNSDGKNGNHHNDDDDDANAPATGEKSEETSQTAKVASNDVMAALQDASQRHHFLRQWAASTGKTSISEVVYSSFAKITTAMGQINFVFSGSQVASLFLEYCEAPCRRYYLPLASGVGLQQRLRVLPLVSAMNAFHLKNHLELPGVLYEVVKNAPALAGKVLETFLTDGLTVRNLHGGPARVVQEGPGRTMVLGLYQPQELFVELPLYQRLLRRPRSTRRRLVELLQKQLCSPSGYLNANVDSTPSDVRRGLVLPCSATTCQVHPFALFTIFSYQESLEMTGEEKGGAGASGDGSYLLNSSPKEVREVRAWAEVWAEFRATVKVMNTTPERKRDALRVLVHGALLLRSAAVVGTQIDLHLQVPPYGFPLLATSVRPKPGRRRTVDSDALKRATPDTVRKAVSAYKTFFSSSTQTHYPFRPMVGVNGGCDVVCMLGQTLALYDLVTTPEELAGITLRIAEALLGVVHVLEKQVLPEGSPIRRVQCVTVVSMDYQSNFNNNKPKSNAYPSRSSGVANLNDLLQRSGGSSPVLYYVDFATVFEDYVMDHLRELQHPLGLQKEYRTLNDIVDDLERNYNVQVLHEVIASQEELEALLSPTLLQLIPDATVLPPYDSPVVSAEDLMMEALLEPEDSITHNVLDVDEGDDDLGLFEGADEPAQGAEREEVISDAALSNDGKAPSAVKHAVLGADSEHLHESAALLEVMMSGALDLADGTSHEESLASTRQELQKDLLTEDRLNYQGTKRSATALTRETGNVGTASPSPSPPSSTSTANDTSVKDLESDSFAWLHDVLSPEFLPGTIPVRQDRLEARRGGNNINTNNNKDGEDDMDDGDGEETATTNAGNTEEEENVFPVTASRRSAASGRRAAASSSSSRSGGRRPRRQDSKDIINLEQLLSAVGSRNSKNRRKTATARAGGGRTTRRSTRKTATTSARNNKKKSTSATASSSRKKKKATTTTKRPKTASSRKKKK